jgi:hypothetical protein
MGQSLQELFERLFNSDGGEYYFAMIPVFIITAVLIFAIAVAEYIIIAVAYSRMYKKRGLTDTWKCWVPIVQWVAVGDICGVIPFGSKIMRKPGQWLLLTNLAALIIVLGFYAIEMIVLFGGASSSVLLSFIPILLVLLALSVWSVIFSIFLYIRLFRLFDEPNYILYVLLSVFLGGIAYVICLYLAGSKEPREYLPYS